MKRNDRRRAAREPEYDEREPYAEQDEPMELGDVLEPYDDASGAYESAPAPDYGDPYDDYGDYADDGAAEELEDEVDADARFKVAMSVFNVVSILVGIVVILLLAALLISLLNWLGADIRHSVIQLQSNLQ